MSIKFAARVALMIVLILVAFPRSAFAQEPLPQTYASLDKSLTFNYPAEWFVKAANDGYLYYVSASLEFIQVAQTGGNLVSGQAGLAIFSPQFLELFEINATSSLDDVAAIFIGDDNTNRVLGAPEGLTLNDHPSLRIPFHTPQGEGHYYVIKIDDTFMVATSIAFHGEIGASQATHEAILASFQVSPPDPNNALRTYTSDDGSFLFHYPDGFYLPYEYLQGQYESNNNDATYGYDYPTGAASFELHTPAGWVNEAGISPQTALRDLPLSLAPLMIYPYTDTPEILRIGPLSDVTLGNYPGIRLDYEIEGRREGFIVAFEANDTPLAFIGTTALGELGDFEALFYEIIASVQYKPALIMLEGEPQGALAFDTEVHSSVPQYSTDLWTLDLSAGEALWIQFILGANDHFINLYASDGINALPNSYLIGDQFYLFAPTDQRYTLAITPFSSNQASPDSEYALIATKLSDIPAFNSGETVSIDLTGNAPAFYRFEGTGGQIVHLSLDKLDYVPNINIFSASGIDIAAEYATRVSTTYNAILPQTASYFMVFSKRYADNLQTLSVSMSELSPTPIEIGTSIEGHYNDETLYYSFEANAGDTFNFDASSEIFTPHLRLFRSDGFEISLGAAYAEISSSTVTLPDDGGYILSVGTLYSYNTGAFSLNISH